MAKRSEIEAQIAELNKSLETADPDDEPDEVWVEKDGHRTKLTGARATAWLKKHGYADDEDQGDKPKDGDKDGDKPDPDDKPPAGHGYFRTRTAGRS